MIMQDIIVREGGPAAFARLTGIPYRTVQAWTRAGQPDGRHPPLWLAPIIKDAIAHRKEQHHTPRSRHEARSRE